MIGAKKTGPKNFKLNERSNVIENKVEQKTPLGNINHDLNVVAQQIAMRRSISPIPPTLAEFELQRGDFMESRQESKSKLKQGYMPKWARDYPQSGAKQVRIPIQQEILDEEFEEIERPIVKTQPIKWVYKSVPPRQVRHSAEIVWSSFALVVASFSENVLQWCFALLLMLLIYKLCRFLFK